MLRQQIDQRFFDTPYYVAPNEPVAQEAFAVIREAMRHKSMVALGRLVLSKRERVIALEPYGKGLLGTTLRYPYEVRDAKDYFANLPELALASDMLTLAAQILESKVADFDPKAFRDRYEDALLAHLKANRPVRAGRPLFVAPQRVINLMEALRQSIAQDQKPAGKSAASTSGDPQEGVKYREHDNDRPRLPNLVIRSIWTGMLRSVRQTARRSPASRSADHPGPLLSVQYEPPLQIVACGTDGGGARGVAAQIVQEFGPRRRGRRGRPDERIPRRLLAVRHLHPQVDGA